MNAYTALALQTKCFAVNALGVDDARMQIAQNLERVQQQVRASKAFIRTLTGDDVRLVVLPEYFLTGFPTTESVQEWQAKAVLSIDGPEYERLSKIAQENKLYLSGNVYEADSYFPELYFQCSFLINPSGDVVLRYRRLISMFAPTPHDVLEKYLDHYGYDGLFPVAETEIGCMAAIASEEILYPEIARCLAMKGAEVLLHSTSEIAAPGLTPKDIAKRARAIESMAYLVSANSGGFSGIQLPQQSSDGMSKIIDMKGRVLAEASTGESMVAHAELDLEVLRRYRAKPGMSNLLSRQRNELFAPTYQQCVYPANNMLDEQQQVISVNRSHFEATQLDVIRSLKASGIIKPNGVVIK
ncbi:nitrilase-related carbon-nitrogen hydrolase [Alkalimonas sp. MEB108]|uniref:Nitrilase-related carbon-nitrogen hydrolase n=1 Tax=Alkalimonas cellulosilytica TaxID=3058395 RepID=A0ABU7J8R2_9GAMM|nr:nitrilase-related carbon-nitrogen hydrolase [Alkalimonas sp. MEB108]MEE2002936.1 nitrilase-related carbon-nitrogen hydrolase [Alkalimonas sp. MEB108]